MAVSGVGRRGETRGRPGRGLERWENRDTRPLAHTLHLKFASISYGRQDAAHWPDLEGLILSWASGGCRGPLGAAWRESPTEAPGGSGVCLLRPGTRWPVCLWEGLRTLGLGETAYGCQDLVLSADSGQYCCPPRATARSWQDQPASGGLWGLEPKASELLDHSGGGWASNFPSPLCLMRVPQAGPPLPPPLLPSALLLSPHPLGDRASREAPAY